MRCSRGTSDRSRSAADPRGPASRGRAGLSAAPIAAAPRPLRCGPFCAARAFSSVTEACGRHRKVPFVCMTLARFCDVQRKWFALTWATAPYNARTPPHTVRRGSCHARRAAENLLLFCDLCSNLGGLLSSSLFSYLCGSLGLDRGSDGSVFLLGALRLRVHGLENESLMIAMGALSPLRKPVLMMRV